MKEMRDIIGRHSSCRYCTPHIQYYHIIFLIPTINVFLRFVDRLEFKEKRKTRVLDRNPCQMQSIDRGARIGLENHPESSVGWSFLVSWYLPTYAKPQGFSTLPFWAPDTKRWPHTWAWTCRVLRLYLAKKGKNIEVTDGACAHTYSATSLLCYILRSKNRLPALKPINSANGLHTLGTQYNTHVLYARRTASSEPHFLRVKCSLNWELG